MVYAESILSIDKEEAQKHLELLGYKHGDKIFMRYIHANPAEGQPKSIKKSRLNWEECKRYQSQGYDAYFVINGGGDTDAAVKVGRAIFYEHDNLPKNIQRELWHNLGLPEPTVQIDTGGKSVHSYWVFHQPIGIKDWCELQEDLLEFADGDRSIKNPSRILRLAGCRYMKGDNPGSNIATIITASGKRYNYLELRDVIQVQKAQVTSPLDSIELPVSESVPLELCLTKRSREMLASGTTAPDKQRNDSGIELARDLIGTTAYLKKIEQAYDGNPEILFFDWCRAVALDTDKPKGQPEGIWKSASKDNPSPGSGEDGVQACIKGWHWRENIKPTGRSFSGGIGSGNRRNFDGGSGGNSGDGGDGGNESNVFQFPGGDGSPLTFVKQVLSETKSKAERDSAFVSSRYNPRDLQAIARELEREENISEEQQEAKEALPQLLQKPSLDPRDYLWGDDGRLAQALVDTANAMPANPSKLFTTLIPVAATPIGTSSRIVVKPSARYVQPCIFFAGNVDPTGSNKSGIQNVITSPLIRLEIEANQRYQAELEDYNIKFARWKKRKGNSGDDEPKKPTRKRYLTKDSTIATLEKIHGENPRGILVFAEELVADFKRENAHTGGRGADRESKLDQWNGSCFLTDRAERTVVLERTAVSRTGTIQLETLQNLFRDASIFDSGMIPRWLFDAASSPPRFIEFDDTPDTGIDNLLTHFYKQLEKMPQADYLLSAEAKPVFRDWQHFLVRRTIAQDGAIKQILPKIEAYTARFALWLHVVNAALAGEVPAPTISAFTMSRAVTLAQYYLKQWEFILAINSPELTLTGLLLKMYEHIKSKPNGIKVSLLKSGIRALREIDKKEVHNHCLWLVDNGYAVITDNIITALQRNGEGSGYDIYDSSMTPCHKGQTTTKQGFDKFHDAYDTKNEVDGFPPEINEVHPVVKKPLPENVICHKSDDSVAETVAAQGIEVYDTGDINAVIAHDRCHEQGTVETACDEQPPRLLQMKEAIAPTLSIDQTWQEKYTLINVDADGCGEVARVSPHPLLTDSSDKLEVVDATPTPSPLPEKPSVEVAQSTGNSTVVVEAIAPTTDLQDAPEAAKATVAVETSQILVAAPAPSVVEAIAHTFEGEVVRNEVKELSESSSLNSVQLAEPVQATKPSSPIKVGSRVRVSMKGAERDGMKGTVTAVRGTTTKILLDYHSSIAGKLRELEAGFSHLELLE
jgi:hypothetical protein